MNSFGISDIGRLRSRNEDSYSITENKNMSLYVVCDGIGGHRAGDIASSTSSRFLADMFKEDFEDASYRGLFRRSLSNNIDPEAWLKDSFAKCNLAIQKLSGQDGKYMGMGTTMVACYVDKYHTIIENVGDSRAYVLDLDDNFEQITMDHSYSNELINRYGLSKEEAQKQGKHVITRAIGIWPEVQSDTYELDYKYKYILLCTDGLHGYVNDEEIRQVLIKNTSVKDKCKELVALANSKGGMDNITCILLSGDKK